MNRKQRVVLIIGVLCGTAAVSGCRGGFSNAIERPKGEIEMRRPEALTAELVVEPATNSLSKTGIDVTVRYASPDELEKFFEKEEVFGKLAGKNPYPDETLVFYVKVANHSGKKIKVNPEYFVLIDNINIQYSELSPDNISALFEENSSIWAFARTTGDLAPGPYGMPLKVAGTFGGGGARKMHYLIKQVRLGVGYIHPGIAYDGYVAFPRIHPNASSFRLIVSGIKTDFNAADEPTSSIDFEFPLTVKTVTKK
jgi:hypothetical protein